MKKYSSEASNCLSITSPWMNLEELANYLKISKSKAQELHSQGELPVHYLSPRTPRFNSREIDLWLLEKCADFGASVANNGNKTHIASVAGKNYYKE